MPLPPVRCFTCGRVLGLKWDRYFKLLQEGKHEKTAMDEVGIPPRQYCCRALMLTTIDDSDKINSILPASTDGFTLQSQVCKQGKTRIYEGV